MPAFLATLTSFLAVGLGLGASQINTTAAEPEYQSIFDGRTLGGWSPRNPDYWTVEDGAITARISLERPCTTNQYLVWTGGELADFELKMEVRLNGEGGINGGFQFRSRLLPDGDVCGYQVDNNLRTGWLVRLYDEYGRHDLAFRGERARFDPNGVRTVERLDTSAQSNSGLKTGPANFRLEDWHEYHLVCRGPKISLRVNGTLVAEVEDNDPRRAEPQGILALQLHSGPPTVAQFRKIRLKILKPAEKTVPPQLPPARRELFGAALAAWSLDAGGHGAQPPLRLVPEFYQFELNVRPSGAGAHPDTKVAVLAGAYFEAGKELHLSGSEFTVYLRLRDPAGKWNSALIGKGRGRDRTHFNLYSADAENLDSANTDKDAAATANGRQIALQIRTENGFSQTAFPASKIDATAWHDLVGRYDGRTLSILCDGQLMASTPAEGALLPNSEPLLIGAEMVNDKPSRFFHGELERAAIWPRALKDSELAALSDPAVVQEQKAPIDWAALFKVHWQNRVKAFREQNETLQNVVLLGDSITEGFEIAKYFPGRRILNRGIGADVIGNNMPADDPRGVLQRLDESVFNCAATDLFILIGINDLNTGRTVESMEAGYRELLRRIRDRQPALKIHVQSVLPTGGLHAKQNPAVLAFNQRLRKLAEEFKCDWIDLHTLMRDEKGELKAEFTNDGLHLTEPAYRIWRAEILKALGWE